MSGLNRIRCGWVNQDPLFQDYHDREWGHPLHDDNRLFEFLALSGVQAGLSWYIVLKKRQAFREAFHYFKIEKVARFTPRKVEGLLQNENIIRNRQKLEAIIHNARQVLTVQKEYGSLDDYLWRFVGGEPQKNFWKTLKELPTRSAQSDALSADLKKRGFKFVGTTICYAFMQSVGLVDDHLVTCFRRGG